MSLRARPRTASLRAASFTSCRALALALALVATTATAQSIDDYSRVQREAIDKAMSQASARPATAGAAVSAVASAAASSPVRSMVVPRPSVSVNGVFASASRVVAEVVVNGCAYVLSAGQLVPGTSWRVDAVAVDRVVLGWIDGPGRRGGSAPVARTFELPSAQGGRR